LIKSRDMPPVLANSDNDFIRNDDGPLLHDNNGMAAGRSSQRLYILGYFARRVLPAQDDGLFTYSEMKTA